MCVQLTLGRLRTTTVAVKSSKYYTTWVCVCSLRYPSSNAHSLYCNLWPARLCRFFHVIS